MLKCQSLYFSFQHFHIILILFINTHGLDFFFGRFKEGNFCGERIEHLYSSIYYFILENTSINNQIDLKDFMVKKITFTPSRIILLFY